MPTASDMKISEFPRPWHSTNENEVLIGFLSNGDKPNETESSWFRINIGDKGFTSQIIQSGEEKVTDGKVYTYPGFKFAKKYYWINHKEKDGWIEFYEGFFLEQMMKGKFKGLGGHCLLVGETILTDVVTGRTIGFPWYWAEYIGFKYRTLEHITADLFDTISNKTNESMSLD